ncbi:four helix bundle protein [Geoalkalibacter ferrihydriticus]|uniref:S23 ribosomal protein n=2 Tax=Geoalkalibacter ferrihydriticus TaxID=392333 RepID=A0A0C2HK74_9BACT|nr:four helix bundle protein [Geoalkalibacter ferrihydriticus]KIH75425.1 S23 ribosomal protein [Geoalkalibacter ferrihydriticus DSM 17813]SDM92601.1 four helix bundle protein [Geoalkalibacter ferrihydriticus]
MEKPHKKLNVWQKAVDLSVDTYRITESFPKSELFGLVSQMRRAAVSVSANIAEGAARTGPKDQLHFLNIARALLSELDTHLEIALRIKFVSGTDAQLVSSLMTDVDRLLYGYMKSVRKLVS